MTTQELLAACQAFKPEVAVGEAKVVSDFAQIVQNAFTNLGLYQLADDFEVAESTVSRWGSGIAKPHPQIQKRVVAWIGRRAAKGMSCSGRRGEGRERLSDLTIVG